MADKLDGLIISEILADNAGGAAIDTDGDGSTNKADEFIEIQNGTGAAISLDGYEIWSQKQGQLYTFGPGDSIGAGQTATVLGNYTGTPPAGYYSAGVSENTNWLPDGEGQKFDSIFLVNSATGEYIVLSYGNPPRAPVLPSGFPGTTQSGAGESIDSSAPNGVAFARDANGDLVEATPTPNTPGVVCFVAGTLIETEIGPLPVEALRPGIRIATHDSGWQPLLARHETRLRLDDLTDEDSAHPVRIPAGFLGATRPLDVSPAHCVLWQDRTAELLFGQREVFVPARYLVGHGAILAPVDNGRVCYHHLLLPQHEVIRAHGVLSESLFLGDVAMNARARLGHWHIAPDVALRDLRHTQRARTVLHRFEARVLLQRNVARAA